MLFAISYFAIEFSGILSCPMCGNPSSRASTRPIQGSRQNRVAECKSDEAVFPRGGARDGPFWRSPRSRESRFLDVRARRAFEARPISSMSNLGCPRRGDERRPHEPVTIPGNKSRRTCIEVGRIVERVPSAGWGTRAAREEFWCQPHVSGAGTWRRASEDEGEGSDRARVKHSRRRCQTRHAPRAGR